MHSSNKAKLIDGKGNLRRVNIPIKAAEVMLEEPGHVITPVDDLQRNQRISAMRADDELLVGKVYLLVPVCRVNRRVTREEIAIIENACDKNKSLKRRKRSGAKVLPSVNEEARQEKEDDQVTVLGGKDSCYRHGTHRQWIPVLESISEVY